MVSAVVLAYNRCAEVLLTIEKLKHFKESLPFEFEIVVVDNASVDHTTLKIKEKHPDITLVTKTKNNGIAGWNDGFAIARHKYLLVLDDDSHIESGLVEGVDYLDCNSTVGILALNITSGPYLTDTWLWQNRKPWQDKEDIFGFFGCGAIIRKEVFKKIGGFAEWLLVYAHEWEYGLRCVDAGYKIRYFKNSSVLHRASLTNRSGKTTRIYGTRNEMAIVYKYFNNRWKYLTRMWFNNWKRAKSGDLQAAYYDFLGFLEFLKMKKKLTYTPLSMEAQELFLKSYTNTQPVFYFLYRFKKWVSSKISPKNNLGLADTIHKL